MPTTTLLVRRGYVGVTNVAIAVAIVTIIHPYLTALGLFVIEFPREMNRREILKMNSQFSYLLIFDDRRGSTRICTDDTELARVG